MQAEDSKVAERGRYYVSVRHVEAGLELGVDVPCCIASDRSHQSLDEMPQPEAGQYQWKGQQADIICGSPLPSKVTCLKGGW